MTSQTLKDRMVLLLINGMSNEAAEGFCIQQGQAAEQARSIVAEARKRITVAADYTRDEQIGKAVMRLEDLYAKSMAGQDIRTALQAQRELNRLLSLYADVRRDDSPNEDLDAPAMRRQLDLMAAYLVPLKLADPTYPVEEHARIAAEIIRLHGLAGV
ncbi:MAG: hypothetical protein L6R28_03895 [Planctomycetes bacterium]|nr:hypothetical protein [Planctomycetota bacterium]